MTDPTPTPAAATPDALRDNRDNRDNAPFDTSTQEGRLSAWAAGHITGVATPAVPSPVFEDYSFLDDAAEREWLTGLEPEVVLANAHRIYDLMEEAGLPGESLLREMAFAKASEALGVDYDVFYRAWLSGTRAGLTT